MIFPPYLVLGFALKSDCAKCAGYRKVTLNKQIITQECFLNYMLCIRTFAPVLFNSNVKCKRIRHVPKCKSKPFLAFNKYHFTVNVKKYI